TRCWPRTASDSRSGTRAPRWPSSCPCTSGRAAIGNPPIRPWRTRTRHDRSILRAARRPERRTTAADGSADKPIDRLVVRATATLPEMWAAQAAAAREAGLPAGISVVVDDDGVVVGTVTDGDVRRYVAAHGELPRDAGSVMTTDPILF